MPLKFLIYYCLLLVAACAGAVRFRRLSFPDKIIALVTIMALVNEILSLVAEKVFHNNLPLYHIFCPIELLLISLYFDRSIHFFSHNRIAFAIGITAVPLSILNTIFVQKIRTINSYFLLLEGLIIIMFCLISLHQILMEEEHLPYRFAQFWISSSLLIFWGTTYTGWGIYALLAPNDPVVRFMFGNLLVGINYLLYFIIAAVFFYYKKLAPSGE